MSSATKRDGALFIGEAHGDKKVGVIESCDLVIKNS